MAAKKTKLTITGFVPGTDTKRILSPFEDTYLPFLLKILGTVLHKEVLNKANFTARPRISGNSISAKEMERWSDRDIIRSALFLPAHSGGSEITVVSVLLPDRRKGFVFWVDMKVERDEKNFDLATQVRSRINPSSLPEPLPLEPPATVVKREIQGSLSTLYKFVMGQGPIWVPPSPAPEPLLFSIEIGAPAAPKAPLPPPVPEKPLTPPQTTVVESGLLDPVFMFPPEKLGNLTEPKAQEVLELTAQQLELLTAIKNLAGKLREVDSRLKKLVPSD